MNDHCNVVEEGMNYIRQLQQREQRLQEVIRAAQAELLHFQAHLASPKFSGVEEVQDCCRVVQVRKDWIATKDVTTRLQSISGLLGEGL